MSSNTSSRPSAFEILMCNSRNKQQKTSKSSANKRKLPTPFPLSNCQDKGRQTTESFPNQLEGEENDFNAKGGSITPGNTSGEMSTDEENELKAKCGSLNAKGVMDLEEDDSNDSISKIDNKLLIKKANTGSITPDMSVEELKRKAETFDAKKAAYWGKGERVPFMFVAKAIDTISSMRGRVDIMEILSNVLRTVIKTTPNDLLPMVYLLSNKIASPQEGLELGIGDGLIVKAIAEACGVPEAHITKRNKAVGDLGVVAQAIHSSQSLICKPESLTVARVFNTFERIAKECGKDSHLKKKNHIKGLLVAATDCESLYLIRMLQRKLRVGIAQQTLLAALGHAFVYFGKHSSLKNFEKYSSSKCLEEASKIVKQVYCVTPVYDRIVLALLSGGVWNLQNTCTFSPGIPIAPMSAQSIKGVSEIIDKFQDTEFTCEYKYDGERAQIHYLENGTVEIYSGSGHCPSRNTEKFPDVVASIARLKQPSVMSFVIDCEIVAYDREKHKRLTFQILRTRARKDVAVSKIDVDVCIYAFDILYLNGHQLLQEQLNVRREHLYKSLQQEHGYLHFVTCTNSNDLEEIQKFLDDAVDASCEGLMIKTLSKDATYVPSKRSSNWLKLKKDYLDGLGDSLDLVPIAAFSGQGKRSGSYGAFLLACYDAVSDEFQSICKIGTGFSEAMLKECSASLRSKVIDKPMSYFRYSDKISPDVWFKPTEVWEVRAADLTISPVYHAAIGTVDPDKGISLRFPRLVRVRDDKTPGEASTSDMIADMYKAQKINH